MKLMEQNKKQTAIDWLIENKRLQDLENFLQVNSKVGQEPKTIKLLVNEYLSSADIKSACDKTNFIDKDIQSNYLDKFKDNSIDILHIDIANTGQIIPMVQKYLNIL